MEVSDVYVRCQERSQAVASVEQQPMHLRSWFQWDKGSLGYASLFTITGLMQTQLLNA